MIILLKKNYRKNGERYYQFSPVIKINGKGINNLGHTAPFPVDIPEMAIKFFSIKMKKY